MKEILEWKKRENEKQKIGRAYTTMYPCTGATTFSRMKFRRIAHQNDIKNNMINQNDTHWEDFVRTTLYSVTLTEQRV